MTQPALRDEATLTLCSRCRTPISELDAASHQCPAAASRRIPARVGPWTLLAPRGVRAGASVYSAENEGRRAAVKLFDPEVEPELPALERHMRELRAWSRLAHPNLVQFRAMGRANGQPFVVMEELDASSVEELLAERGFLDPHLALYIAAEVARALEAAQAATLAHRAIQASNILLTVDGRVKLTDPGLNRRQVLGADAGPLPDPVAPELRDGRPGDIRSDIYALGVTLSRMLGAFDDPLDPHGDARPRPAAIPDHLFRLLRRMTANRPEERLDSPAQVRAELRKAIEELPVLQEQMHASAAQGWAMAGLATGFLAAAALTLAAPPPPTRAALPAAGQVEAGEAARPDAPAETEVFQAVYEEPLLPPPSFSYVLGSEEAARAFELAGAAASDSRIRHSGGRLLLPAGGSYTYLHRARMAGDLRAELDLVLAPGSSVALALLGQDGSALSAGVTAWRVRPGRELRERLRQERRLDPDAGVLLAAGNPRVPVAGSALGVSPRAPHHLELRREGRQVRVFVDGREVLRGEVDFAQEYRVAVASPSGGVELRSIAWSADEQRMPVPRT